MSELSELSELSEVREEREGIVKRADSLRIQNHHFKRPLETARLAKGLSAQHGGAIY